MSGKILIFGGTSEGRLLCEALSRAGQSAAVCTATEYGGGIVSGLPYISVHTGRLNAAEITAFILQNGFERVVDTTHPYAAEVSKNIRLACAESGAAYIRLAREEEAWPGAVEVADMAGAVDYLAAHEGVALLSTGSKELAAFCTLPGYRERLYARVLPDAGVIRHCNALGFTGAHIIAMQGPFSHELNLALLRQFGCKYLVTKNTGAAGGMAEKISAAAEAGAQVILVRRPVKENGLCLDEVLALLNLEAHK